MGVISSEIEKDAKFGINSRKRGVGKAVATTTTTTATRLEPKL